MGALLFLVYQLKVIFHSIDKPAGIGCPGFPTNGSSLFGDAFAARHGMDPYAGWSGREGDQYPSSIPLIIYFSTKLLNIILSSFGNTNVRNAR